MRDQAKQDTVSLKAKAKPAANKLSFGLEMVLVLAANFHHGVDAQDTQSNATLLPPAWPDLDGGERRPDEHGATLVQSPSQDLMARIGQRDDWEHFEQHTFDLDQPSQNRSAARLKLNMHGLLEPLWQFDFPQNSVGGSEGVGQQLGTCGGGNGFFVDLMEYARTSAEGLKWLTEDTHTPHSMVLRLEKMAPIPPVYSDLFLTPEITELTELYGTTVHVYIGAPGGSALKNHTDVTDIVVQQLSGSKEWLICNTSKMVDETQIEEADKDVMPPFMQDSDLAKLRAKLPKCATFTTQDMEQLLREEGKCRRVVLEKGDALFLPRGTVHSATVVGTEISTHITLGIDHDMRGGRRLQSTSLCDTTTSCPAGTHSSSGVWSASSCDGGCQSQCNSYNYNVCVGQRCLWYDEQSCDSDCDWSCGCCSCCGSDNCDSSCDESCDYNPCGAYVCDGGTQTQCAASSQVNCDSSCDTCNGCNTCSAGHFTTNSASDSDGTGVSSGARYCNACPAGKFNPSGDASCESCPAGKASSSTGQSSDASCESCTEGHFATNSAFDSDGTGVGSGAIYCNACPAGKFNPSGDSSCESCPAGKAGNGTGQSSNSSCVGCSPGRYAESGSAECLSCPYGLYSAAEQAPSCSPCGPGSFATTNYSTDTNGTAISFGATQCNACPLGTYKPSGDSSCGACSGGSFATTSATDTDGTGTGSGATHCNECPAGKQNLLGDSSCEICSGGTYSTVGLSVCINCPAGKYVEAQGSDDAGDCSPCLLGQYQSLAGEPACNACQPGRFADTIEATSCISCQAGRSSQIGDAGCQDCPSGRSTPVAGGAPTCTLSPCNRCADEACTDEECPSACCVLYNVTTSTWPTFASLNLYIGRLGDAHSTTPLDNGDVSRRCMHLDPDHSCTDDEWVQDGQEDHTLSAWVHARDGDNLVLEGTAVVPQAGVPNSDESGSYMGCFQLNYTDASVAFDMAGIPSPDVRQDLAASRQCHGTPFGCDYETSVQLDTMSSDGDVQESSSRSALSAYTACADLCVGFSFMSLSGSANSTELEQPSTCRCGNTYNHGGRISDPESVCGVQGSDCAGREAGKCQQAHAVYRVGTRGSTFAPSGGRLIAETGSGDQPTTITARMISFTGNSATNGGAISAYHSSVVAVSVTFAHNAALHNGGGIFAVCAPGCEENVVVSRASFSHNVARRGGGIFLAGVSLRVSHTVFHGNRASESGAAIYAHGSAVVPGAEPMVDADTHPWEPSATVHRWSGISLSHGILGDPETTFQSSNTTVGNGTNDVYLAVNFSALVQQSGSVSRSLADFQQTINTDQSQRSGNFVSPDLPQCRTPGLHYTLWADPSYTSDRNWTDFHYSHSDAQGLEGLTIGSTQECLSCYTNAGAAKDFFEVQVDRPIKHSPIAHYDNWSIEVIGTFTPNATGNHTFALQASGEAYVWLGTDADANYSDAIASVPVITGAHNWDTLLRQVSEPQFLHADVAYPIKAKVLVISGPSPPPPLMEHKVNMSEEVCMGARATLPGLERCSSTSSTTQCDFVYPAPYVALNDSFTNASAARRGCIEYGMANGDVPFQLASVHADIEKRQIRDMLGHIGPAWIGLRVDTRSRQFSWADDSSTSYVENQTVQSNSSSNTECVLLYGWGSDIEWSSVQCADDPSKEPLRAICAPTLEPTAPMWRVTNGLPIADQWIISEITMFGDQNCSIELAPAGITVSSMSYGDACVSTDVAADDTVDCPLFTDGVLDSSPHCCDAYPSGTQWAGNTNAAARAPNGTWVAYSFPNPETVQCIAIVHSEVDHQSMANVVLQYSTDGVEWTTFDVLEFETSPSAGVGGCSIVNPCPSGSFCNFEDGNSGHCKPCGDCGGPDPVGCNECGLPQAGADNCVDACGASPTGQHGSHTGAYCDTVASPDPTLARSACPPGMFCNFMYGTERGAYGFCEMCLDCGVPDDSWAGCASCGLPDEGASACNASCNAYPNEISSNEWRIANNATIEDQWIISEVELYSDHNCSQVLEPISIAVSSMDYGVACGGGGGTMAADGTVECPLFTDGTCDTSPHNCCNEGGSQWAGGDGPDDRAREGTWVAYRFAEPTTVRCVQMCHSEDSSQQMTTVLLQYTDDAGINWVSHDVLQFEASGGGATTSNGRRVQALASDTDGVQGDYCTTAGPCADGFFCSFDRGTNTGICQACGDNCDRYRNRICMATSGPGPCQHHPETPGVLLADACTAASETPGHCVYINATDMNSSTATCASVLGNSNIDPDDARSACATACNEYAYMGMSIDGCYCSDEIHGGQVLDRACDFDGDGTMDCGTFEVPSSGLYEDSPCSQHVAVYSVTHILSGDDVVFDEVGCWLDPAAAAAARTAQIKPMVAVAVTEPDGTVRQPIPVTNEDRTHTYLNLGAAAAIESTGSVSPTGCLAEMSGYFRAPMTGEYRFKVSSQQYGALYMNDKLIASCPNGSSPYVYDTYDEQTSQGQPLVAGHFYLLRAIGVVRADNSDVSNEVGREQITVAVVMPDRTPSGVRYAPIVTNYMFPGGNSMAIELNNINVTASESREAAIRVRQWVSLRISGANFTESRRVDHDDGIWARIPEEEQGRELDRDIKASDLTPPILLRDIVYGPWDPAVIVQAAGTEDAAATTCAANPCDVGYSCRDDDSSTTCIRCRPGSISPEGLTCVPCEGGSGPNSAGSACTMCSDGTYSNCNTRGCEICAPPGQVNDERSECSIPDFQCEASTFCSSGACGWQEDCENCAPGTISRQGDALCTICRTNGNSWVANHNQTACEECQGGSEPLSDRSGCDRCRAQEYSSAETDGACVVCESPSVVNLNGSTCTRCPPGQGPNANRDMCVRCAGREASMNGEPCQQCPEGKITSTENDACNDCPGNHEVAVNGTCLCEPDHYDVSHGMLSCSVGSLDCDGPGTLATRGCEPCPDCVRCPVGPDGRSSTPLINPGYGLPKHWAGQTLVKIRESASAMPIAKVVLYPCPLSKMCAGDHFTVPSRMIDASNIAIAMPIDTVGVEELQFLVEAAGKSVEEDLRQLHKALIEPNEETLINLLRDYYLEARDTDVVVFDETMLALSSANWPGSSNNASSLAGRPELFKSQLERRPIEHSTRFSCRFGHDEASPVCTTCTYEYAGGSTTLCNSCDAASTFVNIIKFVGMCAIAYVVLQYLPAKAVQVRERHKQQLINDESKRGHVHVATQHQQKASVMVYAKILTSHFQVLLGFHAALDISFPEPFASCIDAVHLLKGDLIKALNLKCALTLDVYMEFWAVITVIPFALLVCIAADAYQQWQLKRHIPPPTSVGVPPKEVDVTVPYEMQSGKTTPAVATADQTGRWEALLNRMFILVFLMYSLIVTRIFHMFACRPFHDSEADEEWHRYDYSIDCTEPVYKTYEKLAYVMVFVYPFGIPIVSLWIIRQNADRLSGNSSRKFVVAPVADHVQSEGIAPQVADDQSENMESENKVDHLVSEQQDSPSAAQPWWYGDRATFDFMCRDYKTQYYYYEIIEFLRKLSLTGFLTMLQTGSVMQIFVGISIAFGFGAANAVVRPYADPRANHMRLTADASLFFTLVCALIIHFQDSLSGCDDLTTQALAWLLVAINFGLLILFVVLETLVRLKGMMNDAQLVGISYCPDVPLTLQNTNATGSSIIYSGEYKATSSATSMLCAVKIRPSHEDKRILLTETAIMLRCNHPNVMRIQHMEENCSLYYICLELCTESVEVAVRRNRLVSDETKVALCRSMMQGVHAFHTAGFFHGNCNASNFVLGDDGEPRLCGFSSAGILGGEGTVTRLTTVFSAVGYMPPEVIRGRHHQFTEVSQPVKVDVFSLGVTFCFILSNGTLPFVGTAPNDVEASILAGDHAVDDIASMSPEAKHMVNLMLSARPTARASLQYIEQKHPIFWTTKEKVKFIGEKIGLELPPKVHRSKCGKGKQQNKTAAKWKEKLILELEEAFDQELGPYNESDPAAGGSWARSLDPRYPLTGDWGSSGQRAPADEERDYHVYGGPAKPKEIKQRNDLVKKGKAPKCYEIRSVGYLKFVRNMDAHAGQAVQAGRFETVEAVHHYVLGPFPWMLMAVYSAHERHSKDGDDTDANNSDVQTANPLSDLARQLKESPVPQPEPMSPPFLQSEGVNETEESVEFFNALNHDRSKKKKNNKKKKKKDADEEGVVEENGPVTFKNPLELSASDDDDEGDLSDE